MGIFSRFFGRKDNNDRSKDNDATKLVANPDRENPLCLIALFSDTLQLNANQLTKHLRDFDPSMSKAIVDLDSGSCQQGTPLGLVGWENHVIQLVGFNSPMPADALAHCVKGAHYNQELKEKIYQHKANILLYYAGYEKDPIKQYVALSCVVGALAEMGAIAVINENANTSLPATILADDSQSSRLSLIQTLPLLILFCGFVKYEVEGIKGVWMRTHGAHLLGMPDFAVLANDHNEGESYFEMFSNLYYYLLDSGAKFHDGDTMQIGEDRFMKLRQATAEEYFLDNDGPLFAVEVISESDINR